MTRHRAESGQILAFALLAMPVILGVVGLAIDVGYFRYTKRVMQTAADAGAIAGGLAINDAAGDYKTLAQSATAADGFANGTNGITVTVSSPPQNAAPAGPCSTQPTSCVEVTITQSKSPVFAAVLGVGPMSIGASAVAWGGANGKSCVYALSPSAAPGVSISGVNYNAPNCGTLIDSGSDPALSATGSNINTSYFGMVGSGYSDAGSNTGSTKFVTGIAPVGDPLAYLPDPSITLPCAGTADTISGQIGVTVTPGSSCYKVTVSGSINVAFNPGQYSSITISGSTGVTFNSGLYTIVGTNGSDALNFGGSNVSASGVTFYIGPNAGAVSVAGSNSTFSAPTTGTYAGILFFQNPSNTNGATVGGSNATTTGAFYFPKAQLTFDGSNASTPYTILVAYTIVYAGSNATLNNNYGGLPGGSPIHTAVLVE